MCAKKGAEKGVDLGRKAGSLQEALYIYERLSHRIILVARIWEVGGETWK